MKLVSWPHVGTSGVLLLVQQTYGENPLEPGCRYSWSWCVVKFVGDNVGDGENGWMLTVISVARCKCHTNNGSNGLQPVFFYISLEIHPLPGNSEGLPEACLLPPPGHAWVRLPVSFSFRHTTMQGTGKSCWRGRSQPSPERKHWQIFQLEKSVHVPIMTY